MMESYNNIQIIGTGGCAEVWLCERSTDSKPFAKKMLLHSAGEKMKRRFREEVRILAKLDHPKIVRVVSTQLSTDPLWFVMPRYSHSLKDQLPQIIGDVKRIKKIFTQILDAVEYAHREGVIHRDLKPHNILMNSDDDLAVSDFGIGRVLDAVGDRVTRTGAAMGTRYYMSPEQSTDAKHVDLRTDIFSLGRMLYELYTEKLNTAVQQLDRVPAAVAPIISKCTKTQPDERYASIAEMKEEWRAVLRAEESPDNAAETTRLVAEIIATPSNASKVVSLLSLISTDNHDSDLLADVLLRIPYGAVAVAYQAEPTLVVGSIERFTDYLLSQGWGVSYVDKVGVRCANLFSALPDPSLRIRLLLCTLSLGISHRRPIVIEAASHLLQSLKEPSDIEQLKSRISALDQQVLAKVHSVIELDECDPEVAQVFE